MRPNRLLVKYLGGFVVVHDTVDIAARGAVEGFYSLRVDTEAAAVAEADAVLADVNTIYDAVQLGVLPTTGAVPYDDYAVGDTVTAPDASGGTDDLRVVGLTVTQTPEGVVQYAPELNRVVPLPEVEQASLLRRLGDDLGAAPRGGVQPVTNERASRVTFSPTPLVGYSPPTISEPPGGGTGGGGGIPIPTFSLPGLVVVSASGRWEGRTADYDVVGGVARLTTAGTTDTVVELLLNGTTIVTWTLGSGVDRVEEAITAELLTAETDYLTVEVTTAGTGAAGLVIEVDLVAA